MFKQFTEHVQGTQIYLLCSLGIFLVFFIVVALLLLRMRKSYASYMSDVPLTDSINDNLMLSDHEN